MDFGWSILIGWAILAFTLLAIIGLATFTIRLLLTLIDQYSKSNTDG
jgi:hypothetical protein